MSTAGTRYVTINDDDLGGQLWVVTILSLSFCIAAVFARFLSKARFGLGFTVDDWPILAAFALVICQTGLVITALAYGLGKSENVVDQSRVDSIYRIFRASQAFLYLTLYLTKCAMILLIARVFTKSLLPICAAFAALGIASVILVTAGCTGLECSNSGPVARWSVITAFDLVSEVIIVALPVILLPNIKMNMRGKLKVLLSLNTRLATAAFSALALWAILKVVDDSPSEFSHPTVAIVLPSIFQQSEICLAFSTTSILPCFRLLFTSWDLQRMDDSQIPAFMPGERKERPGKTRKPIPKPQGPLAEVIRVDEHYPERSMLSSRGSIQHIPASVQGSLRTKSSQTPIVA